MDLNPRAFVSKYGMLLKINFLIKRLDFFFSYDRGEPKEVEVVVVMGKFLRIMILGTLLVGLPVYCLAESGLIPVKPSYTEAAYTPSNTTEQMNSAAVPTPSPRDQMYVFWILGKMLSYPVDKVESFILSKLKRNSDSAVATPAGASSQPNPFQSINWREIPPAPPARPR